MAANSETGTTRPANADIDGSYAWFRLTISLLLGTIGGIGLWSFVVVLPAVQAEFGIPRADAALPYTTTMIGFAVGGVLMGRLSDRFGIVAPVVIGALALCAGYFAAANATSIWQFALAQGLLIGLLGTSATFGPLITDISLWFDRRRGIAVAVAASGNYLAGTIWPPILQHFIDAVGWRQTYVGIAILCVVTMLPLTLLLRRPSPGLAASAAKQDANGLVRPLPVSPNALLALLALAGLSCCVAMSMPQVHIVAYCGDLGYGPARGAEMLSLMLGFGVVSRLASGWISDHIGGTWTLLIGSALQMLALIFYLPFDGLVSLYIVSALFGLSQGGIVPSYAIIIREHFPAKGAATRVGIVLMMTVLGMALGGWLSGVIFDLSGSYSAAFVNGILWNVITVSVALWLLWVQRRPRPHLAPA